MADVARIAAALRQLADALEDPGPPLAASAAERGHMSNSAGSGRDMSAADLGQQFGRSASWAKAEIRAGRFPGAYRLPNGAWRVPAAGAEAYVTARRGATSGDSAATVVPLRPRTKGSISDWRKVRRSA